MKIGMVCKHCGKHFVSDTVQRWVCDECREKRLKEKQANKNFFYRLRNYKKLSEYHHHYNLFRRKGMGSLGANISRDTVGEIDFEREERVVRNELNNIRYGRYRTNSLKWIEKRFEEITSEKHGIWYLFNIIPQNFEDVCGHCFYASFPNGIDEKGECKLGKKPNGLWDITPMCWEMKLA